MEFNQQHLEKKDNCSDGSFRILWGFWLSGDENIQSTEWYFPSCRLCSVVGFQRGSLCSESMLCMFTHVLSHCFFVYPSDSVVVMVLCFHIMFSILSIITDGRNTKPAAWREQDHIITKRLIWCSHLRLTCKTLQHVLGAYKVFMDI